MADRVGSAPRSAQGAKARLLAAAVDHVLAQGIGELSLRGLAAAIGTSHRMLIYHFGSREGLLVEVVHAIEAGQRAALADLREDVERAAGPNGSGGSPEELMRRFWRRLTDPALWPAERLFFELYGRALQGGHGTAAFLDGIVESWLGPLTELARRAGHPPTEARAAARLGLATARGLLLDLLATGDRAGVDAAAERFVTVWAHPPG